MPRDRKIGLRHPCPQTGFYYWSMFILPLSLPKRLAQNVSPKTRSPERVAQHVSPKTSLPQNAHPMSKTSPLQNVPYPRNSSYYKISLDHLVEGHFVIRYGYVIRRRRFAISRLALSVLQYWPWR